MSAIATSYFDLPNSAIILCVLIDLAVLIGVGFSRSKWMGFVCGGVTGLVFFGIALYQSGGGAIFYLLFSFWVPIVVLVNANLGIIAAMIGDFVAIKSGKEPRDRF